MGSAGHAGKATCKKLDEKVRRETYTIQGEAGRLERLSPLQD